MTEIKKIPYSGHYRISDAQDYERARKTIHLIESQPLAFSKKLLTGHVTGSAFILNQSREKVLLTHHAKLGIWIQLGGHCDGIKDPFFTAQREAYEESGLKQVTPLSADILDIDIHQIPETSKAPAHLHYDIRYLFEADENETLVITDESHDLKWVRLTELETYSSETSLLKMRAKLDNLLD